VIRLIAIAGLAAAAALTVIGGPASASLEGDFARAERLLLEWQFDDARRATRKLAKRAPRSDEARYMKAQLAFYDGDYKRALELVTPLDDDDVYGRAGYLRSLAASTHEATDGFASYRSEGGHFEVLYPPGKDEVIAELTAEVLEAAYRVVGKDFDHYPDRVIRVEILPRPRDLARVSTLTETDIETTGTIALCKYGKLMVVSPRATMFGYSWMDTLVHEYVHYVISAKTEDKTPVWLQEGLARFEQTRWRDEPGLELADYESGLLGEALRKRKLITFDEMHPSMAKLPSQEAAALAFAEVYTMVGYVHREVGYGGLRAALDDIRGGRSARRAVAQAMSGKTWNEVERGWKTFLRKMKLSGAARDSHVGIRFKKGDAPVDENAGVDRVGSDKARKFARLGGLLRTRGLNEAAAIEYEKALDSGGPDNFVAAKLSRTYLELGNHDRAIELAKPLPGADEGDASPHVTLGIAYLATRRFAPAARAFEDALRINPFDPTVRCGLAEAYAQIDDTKRATREQSACAILRNSTHEATSGPSRARP